MSNRKFYECNFSINTIIWSGIIFDEEEYWEVWLTLNDLFSESKKWSNDNLENYLSYEIEAETVELNKHVERITVDQMEKRNVRATIRETRRCEWRFCTGYDQVHIHNEDRWYPEDAELQVSFSDLRLKDDTSDQGYGFFEVSEVLEGDEWVTFPSKVWNFCKEQIITHHAFHRLGVEKPG